MDQSNSAENKESLLQKWKTILQIAWPLIIANSFWNLQITIDRIYLGTYSTESLGAAMAVMGVFWTPMALLQQTASYLTTFVAQYYGANRESEIGLCFWQAIIISILGGLLVLLFIPFSPSLFQFIGHSATLQKLENEYFITLCYSALPTAIVAAASAFFTGLGNTKIIMAINCIGLIANAILDYLMIFGNFGFPKLGIAGAGYATAIATWFSAIFALYLVLQKKHESKFKILSSIRFDLNIMKRFMRFGFPSGLQWAFEGLAFTIFLIIIGRMNQGEAALSSSGIVVTIMMLAVLPALGLAQATSVLLGQSLGEGKPHKAESVAWSGLQIAFIYIFSVALTFALFPEFYLSWFRNEENMKLWSEVSLIAPILLLYVAFFICFDSMNLIFSFCLKGAGDTKFVTFVALILPWPLMVLPTYFFKDHENSIYLAWAFASFFIITQAFIFLVRFIKGKWKSMSVIR